jgi:hypothetical protein
LRLIKVFCVAVTHLEEIENDNLVAISFNLMCCKPR